MFNLNIVKGGILFNHGILSSYLAHNFDRGSISPDWIWVNFGDGGFWQTNKPTDYAAALFISYRKYLYRRQLPTYLTHPLSYFRYSTRVFFFLWRFHPIPGHGLPLRDFTITLIGHTTLGRTPLDEWSARRRDLYLTKHDSHKRQTFLPPAGFEPTTPASERLQTHSIDRTATGISRHLSN
jgi:hypothetical protein